MRSLAPAIAAGIAALLSSCGMRNDLLVVRGNRLYASGRIHEASAMYLRAGAGEEPVASYDLANAFLELGEAGPASALFGAAVDAGKPAISARAWYNQGVWSWNRASYREAASAFRKGLEAYLALDGGRPAQAGRDASADRVDAKFRAELSRAYELALLAAERKRDAGQVERGAYSATEVNSEAMALALSRYEERSLFLPGKPDEGGGVDH